MQLCTTCQRAPLAVGDRFCFVCGATLREVELVLEQDYVVAAPGVEEPQTLWGTLRNTGQFGVEAGLAPPDVPWMALFPGEGDDPLHESWTLAPGGEARFRVQVQPDGLRSGPMTSALRVLDREGSFRHVLRHIRVFPPPRLEVVLDADTGIEMAQTVAPRVYGTVRVLSGGDVHVDRASTDAAWASADMQEGRLAVGVDLDALRRALGTEHPAHMPLPVQFVLADPPVSVEHVVQLPLRWPATLQVALEYAGNACEADGSLEMTAGHYHVVTLVFENPGGAVLALQSVALDPPELPVYWVEQPPDEVHPWEIGPSGTRILRCAVDLRRETRPFDLAFSIRSTSPGQEQQRASIRIEPKTLPLFNGAVGLDFGTSSSCLSLWPRFASHPEPARYAQTYVQTGGRASGGIGTVPSNVLYRARFTEDLRHRWIGREIDADAEAEPLVHSVKRNLGQDSVYDVRFVDQRVTLPLTASEVAGDILASLVWGAEAELGARITNCALTHPARFSTLQIAAIRDSLQASGVVVDRLLPEPVAAALDFAVVDPDPPAFPRDYHLLVFDIGGGTTDFALVHVRDVIDTVVQVRTITPSLLAVDGNRWAGGDDITWGVLRFALETGDPAIIAEALGVSPDDLPRIRSVLETRDPVHWWTDRTITQAFAAADAVKRARADEAWEGSGGDLLAQRGAILPSAEELRMVADRFYDDYELETMARDILADHDIEHPDVILLVGQSWRIQALVQRVTSAFPQSRVHPLTGADLKLPVARGACRAHMYADPEFGYTLDMSALTSFVTARIGLVRADIHTGSNAFIEIIGGRARLNEWRPVPGGVRRDRKVEIWENTGYSDTVTLEVAGTRIANREIRRLGTISLQEVDLSRVSDADLAAGAIELCISGEHKVQARVCIGDDTWPLDLLPTRS
jgi:hypothetical protein